MRIASTLAFVLAALAIATPALGEQQATLSPALAWADCAPWDGPAFRVVLGRPATKEVDVKRPWLEIAIWRKAASRYGATFVFPDTDGKTGAIIYRGTALPPVSGTVTFAREEADLDVDGSFDLVTPDGRLTGRFQGRWEQRRVFCGM